MIQNRLNDKEKDIQGLKKQTSSLFNCAWEKGYAAGFDDGYKTGRQAEERPKGKWKESGFVMEGDMYEECHCDMRTGYYCSWCGYPTFERSNYCPNCGTPMEVKND